MTAFDYARAKATADRLLARFGQEGSIKRPTTTGPDYDPVPGTPETYPATFAVMDYATNQIDGSRILANDRRVIMAKGGLTIEPLPSDRLVQADASEYAIVSVKPMSPAGAVVYYEIQARR